MRKQKALLVASLVLLLLGMAAWQCPTPTPEGPGPTPTFTPSPTPTFTPTPTPTPTPTIPPSSISCERAIDHVGEIKTVCGLFYVSYRPDVGGNPTFFNCPVDYPNHDFAALIWGDERPIFESCLGGPPEKKLHMHTLCIEGLVEIYHTDRLNRDIPQIILKECGQLTVSQ